MPEQDTVQQLYNDLQYSLQETGYPQTEDRTQTPRTKQPESGITIAILSPLKECLPILLQGGESCPGNVHLVLSTSWLTVKHSERNPPLKAVYLHKAISMYKGGSSFLDVFDPPRRVSYLTNNFADGFENGLDCPTSNPVNGRLDDRIWTRILMARAGVAYPETLAFCCDVSGYEVPDDANIDLQKIDSQTDLLHGVVGKGMEKFLTSIDSLNCQIMIKPIKNSYDEKTASIHSKDEYENICNRAVTLLSQPESGNGVLIEKFYDPGSKAVGRDDATFRISVITCRGRCDEPITTGFICRVGRKNEPITSENTVPQSIQATLSQWGIAASEIRRIKKQLVNDSANLLRIMILDEEKAKNTITDCQTDMIIVDYVLTNQEGQYVPIGIGVKSRRSLSSFLAYELINTNLHPGTSVIPLIEMMCEKSQKFAMWGKTLVVLGKGRASKDFMWTTAKHDNMKMIVVDCKTGYIPDVAYFIDYDLSDHTRDDEHVANIIHLLKSSGLKIDGCCTVSEDCIVLCAEICELLSLNGSGINGAKIAKQKSSTLKAIHESRSEYKHFPQTRNYADKSVHVETEADIDASPVQFPCIIKREYGGGSVGVKLVQDINEAKGYFNVVRSKVETEEVTPITGKSFGTSMMMMNFLEGVEHDIQLVMYKGQLITAFVWDNGPTRKPSYFETSLCMPSCLSAEQVKQMTTAAYQCCRAIGLVSGVFDVEMVSTSKGPKLIEINARIGGFSVTWIKECSGIDFIRCVYMCACSVRPHVYTHTPRVYILGVTCLHSLHAHLWNMMDEINELQSSGEILFTPIQSYAPDEVVDADTEIHICYVGVKADNLDEAKVKLIDVCERLRISSDEYEVEKFIDFRSQGHCLDLDY
ncbi:carnosine synthase 1-like [Tubulanus polymorphus]|uniref:carnosine synthase 1-like n=1 Tax=Tubulanus polymorphus TaxID=672921 RepID=UPI003DA5C744